MVETLEGHVLQDWTRARTPSGVPYYVNHSRGVTQWDHPEYVRIFEEIQSLNSVKYAAYRTACKLRRLQTRLKLQDVSLQNVASAFDSVGLRTGENSDLVEVKQVEEVVQRVLRGGHKQRQGPAVLASHLTINLLLNIYDLGRSGMVQVLGCKVLLVVLCGGRLQEKYRYLFNQVADHNNCCTRRRLAAILRDLARIPELLSEQPSFGLSLVSAAVESCFKEVEGEVGMTEEVLLAWLLREPQTLVWWTTLYRLTAAELVCHDVKCGVCKQRPIIGLRYQCLRCLGYNQCQDCFLHARTSRGHKLSHPIQEYCHETSGKEWRRALVKIMKHRLKARPGYAKPRYLAIPSSPSLVSDATSVLCEGQSSVSWSETSEDDHHEEEEEELFSRTILNTSHESEGESREGTEGEHRAAEPTILPTSPRHQIHSVILHLQDGHRQLEEGASGSVVEAYTQQLQTQINKLQQVLQKVTCGPVLQRGSSRQTRPAHEVGRVLPRLESTPIVGERGLLLNLSPIVTRPSHDDTAVMDNKENHWVENPNGCQVKEGRHAEPPRPPLTPHHANTGLPADCSGEKTVAQAPGLPSFTEVNFSDLTSMTCGAGSPSESHMEMRGSCQAGDASASDIKHELENILLQLDQIFLSAESQTGESGGGQDSQGVVAAACELGDILAEYVNAVPSQPD
ncbi:Dystrophin, isoform E [Chionoecetes opilio]|uniref:Dystrophin, isoform E n=1 Tax=Chionoecetes opilio TaxID=41210 RepID=A0A8J4YTP7_CHIOP|nr:Dystrophin, isoform E [Chionoecetes opilio]